MTELKISIGLPTVDDHDMPPGEAAKVPITGSPEEVVQRFAAYAAVGAEHLVINLDGEAWSVSASSSSKPTPC